MKGTKGKAPAFQFYVADWLSDEALMGSELSTQAIWLKILCYMWKDNRGYCLDRTPKQLVNMLSISWGALVQFIEDAMDLEFCDIWLTWDEPPKDLVGLADYKDNLQFVRIESRRFRREHEQRLKWAADKERQRQKEREKRESGKSQGDVSQDSNESPPVSSTSSSPSTSKPFKYPVWFEAFWTDYPNIRRMKKRKCFEKLSRHRKNGTKIDDVMIGLQKWKQSAMWIKQGGQFTHSPEVWINNVLWEEDPPTTQQVEQETTDARSRAFQDFVGRD